MIIILGKAVCSLLSDLSHLGSFTLGVASCRVDSQAVVAPLSLLSGRLIGSNEIPDFREEFGIPICQYVPPLRHSLRSFACAVQMDANGSQSLKRRNPCPTGNVNAASRRSP